MIKFSIRLFDLELVSCDEKLIHDTEEPKTAKIQRLGIKGAKGTVSTIVAYWERDKENSFSLKFIGGRPFDEGKEVFWELAKIGQDLLESCIEVSSKFSEGKK